MLQRNLNYQRMWIVTFYIVTDAAKNRKATKSPISENGR